MSNPYITDRPLQHDDLFFGREAAFAQLASAVARGEPCLLLYGPPGSGKTSLLNLLDLHLLRTRILRVSWSSLRGATSWQKVSYALAQSLGYPGTPDSDSELEAWLRQDRHLDPGQTGLLCLDGISANDLKDGHAWLDALERWGHLRTVVGSLSLLLVIETWFDRAALPEALRDIPTVALSPLSERDTQDLITIPVRGRLSYDYESLRRIYRYSGGDPRLAQLFGRMLFDRRISTGWVGPPDVDRVADEMIAYEAASFVGHWEVCSPVARIALCAFTEMSGRRDMGSIDDVALYLRQMGFAVPREDLGAALEELARHELLDRLGGETYRFRAELLKLWVRAHKSAADELAHQRNYQREHIQGVAPERPRRVDPLSLLLWGVALALVVLIAVVWQSRQTNILWTAKPTPPAAQSGQTLTRVLPTPEQGVAPGHIVYIAKPSTEYPWSVYVMRSDGSDPVRLTDSGSNDTAPCWSPDGKHIAFVSERDGNREIYVMNSDGNSQTNLTHNGAEDWTPSWSPDGSRIAFASFRDDNWEIYVMDTNGSNLQRLTRDDAADYGPSWSPDGAQIAFVSQRDGNIEIYLMRADGSDPRRFTDDPDTDQTPAWSPDGTQILWESYRENNMELFIAGVDGSDPRPVSRDAYADDHGPTWSPWDGRIAYYSNRDQGWDIYTLDLTTGERVNLTLSEELEQAPCWGP